MQEFRARTLVIEAGDQGQSTVRGEADEPLKMLLGVTGLVLLIACANIANLLLARAGRRSGEMAVRLSIGANRSQLVRQLLTESLILAGIGGLVGLLVAQWMLHLIAAMLPEQTPFKIQLDPTVLAFAAVLTLGTGLLFGLFPALHSTRPDLLPTLKGQSGQPSGARGAAMFRTSLAIFQIAISTALLIAAGLFVKSLANVSRVDLGLKTENVVTFGVSPELNAYSQERAPGAVRPDGGGVVGAPRRYRRHRRGRRRPGRQQLGDRRDRAGLPAGTRHRFQRPLQHGRPRILQDPRHPVARRTRVHGAGLDESPEGRDRERSLRREVQARERRRRQTDDRRWRQAGYADHRRRPECQVLGGQGGGAGALLRALQADASASRR